MKICIVSDSHDRGPKMARAVAEAKSRGAEAVLHAGDLIGANTLKETLKLGLPVHAVHGNNLGDPVLIARLACNSEGLLQYHGQDASLKLGGRSIFLTHYPHIAHGMACTGDFDLVICGHSHVPDLRQQPNIQGGATWVINPGAVSGLGTKAATWVFGDLERLEFTLETLSS